MDGSSAGLRFKSPRLTGTAGCLHGPSGQLQASVRGGRIIGTLGRLAIALAFSGGPPQPGAQQPRAPLSITGAYKLVPRSLCLGDRIELSGSRDHLRFTGKARVHGQVRYGTGGRITGAAGCADGGTAAVSGQAVDRNLSLMLTRVRAPRERVVAEKQRAFDNGVAAFFLAVVVVMVCARLAGALAVRLRQPRVMGEVTAGILLGPTVFGALAPNVQRSLFPSDLIPYVGVAANLGLIFYMFLVGLELDLSQLKGRLVQTAAISNTGVVIPMMAGLLVAIPTYTLLGPNSRFAAFALFVGVAMSITAFPVLARILTERRMLKRPLGALALASA